jgi:hypothetical protein
VSGRCDPGKIIEVGSAASGFPQRVLGGVLFAARKGCLLTNMTLAQAFRSSDHAATARVVVRWDGETGWAHLAIAEPGDRCARFVGFHQFAGGGADAVVAELASAGCVIASAPRLDDDMMEIEAVLGLREVIPDAAR